ncbi:TPA: hypothetical protein NI674_006243 [Pseudomonas aeruginosa]|uniref:hypothetical protein n=1 Tax=Pseudomonas aeruginosa group TaxID=136841 RepID=UPI0012D8F37A|nr:MULTISPECIES: hypothetical protein [Pseudomonas aeruginosa group]MBH9459201.1 hypothetical protein [Pseudomonas aeruginosa]MBH9465958.1 hypothetical protein [Pseudomonas aeruginosa]MUI47043.1 hypothetical protein [Pseudomonas aeruginosa]QPZ62102.1 hypothetical protein I9X26_12150 [Pseudomonas aeruginosa]HCF0987696.1 hypothetical protein [Pseudomonas aeruginosa]
MANNYYDATGVLVLDQVTPVITTLFGTMNLNPSYPGNGEAYFAMIAGQTGAHWDNIRDDLIAFAQSLGLSVPSKDAPAMDDVLDILAVHFGTDQDEEPQHLIEHHPFEDDVGLAALFLIATRLDDGHGLKEIRMEGCWYCDKARLFNFGGEGSFISREYSVYGATGHVLFVGNRIRQALLVNDLETATNELVIETRRLLGGIGDETQRQQLQERLATLLH